MDGRILSKSILGTFYLPQRVYCISEASLTLSTCSIHAAVGEAAKATSMSGKASTDAGRRGFHNTPGCDGAYQQQHPLR